MFIWFQSPDTSPIFHRSSKITKSDPVISSARSCSSLEYNVPGKEAWSSMLTHSLFTSLSFSDLFYAPVCSTLSIHNVILLGRANEGQEFLNSFESISPMHLLLPFFFFFSFFTLQLAPDRILCLLRHPEHCPQVTVYPELLLFWRHLHKSSSSYIFILWFLVMSFEELNSHRIAIKPEESFYSETTLSSSLEWYAIS